MNYDMTADEEANMRDMRCGEEPSAPVFVHWRDLGDTPFGIIECDDLEEALSDARYILACATGDHPYAVFISASMTPPWRPSPVRLNQSSMAPTGYWPSEA